MKTKQKFQAWRNYALSTGTIDNIPPNPNRKILVIKLLSTSSGNCQVFFGEDLGTGINFYIEPGESIYMDHHCWQGPVYIADADFVYVMEFSEWET